MKNKQNKHLYILPINKKVTVVYVVFFNLINLSEVALMGRIKKPTLIEIPFEWAQL